MRCRVGNNENNHGRLPELQAAMSFFLHDQTGLRGEAPTYQLLDVCVNDCVVFIDAPAACDPNGLRQNSKRNRCPKCLQSRYVIGGELDGRPRRQIFHFPINSIFRFLFSQPGWSSKLNGSFGVHPSDLDPNWLMEVALTAAHPNSPSCRIFGIRPVGNSRWWTVP